MTKGDAAHSVVPTSPAGQREATRDERDLVHQIKTLSRDIVERSDELIDYATRRRRRHAKDE